MIPSTGQDPGSHLSSILDIIDKATKIAALFIGACWAYVNYIRGRTFRKRLELKISAQEMQREARRFILGSAQIKNVGLSKFPIEQKGTAIVLKELKAPPPGNVPVELTEETVGVREVFKDHGWIEPGETIAEDFVLQLPNGREVIGMKLDLRVVAAHIEWNANCIVEIGSKRRDDDGETTQRTKARNGRHREAQAGSE